MIFRQVMRNFKTGGFDPVTQDYLDSHYLGGGSGALDAQKGAPDGVASLDGNAQVVSDQISSLDASQVTTGIFEVARITGALGASDIAYLDAGGFVTADQIPDLDAAKVTTGVFSTDQIPTLDASQLPNFDASQVPTGVFAIEQIPVALIVDMDAAQVTAGVFAVAQIPELDAAQVTTGVFSSEQIPALTILAGVAVDRPFPTVGAQFFDTDLGKPIWGNGITWVDATGTEV